MERVKFEFLTCLKFSEAVPGQYFSLRCVPQYTARQMITSLDVSIFPKVKTWENTDSFENRIISGRYDFPHMNFVFGISGIAQTDCTAIDESGMMDCYFFSSPMTRAGSEISDFYNKYKSELSGTKYDRAMFLSNAIHEVMEYSPGETGIATTAEEAFRMKKGVCQDYSHILLSLLRLDGIACRYAAGISAGEGETHGWVEMYDRGWIGIDPTNNKRCDDFYIRLSQGRDFRDCSIDRGMLFGGFTYQTQTISAFLTN